MIIDMHSHLWAAGYLCDSFFVPMAEEWAAKEPGRRPEAILPRLVEGVVDNDGRMFIDNMDRAGVAVSFAMALDVGVYSGQEPRVPIEEQLRRYGELQRIYPGRLYFLAHIDPRRSNCVDTFARAISEWGLRGLGEFNVDGFHLDDELPQPLFKVCVELGVPVAIHCRGDIGARGARTESSLENPSHPAHIGALAQRYPTLNIILSHAGYPFWWQAAAQVGQRWQNCYLELSNWDEELADVASLVAKLACMRDAVGAERLLFGSDQPSGARFCGQRSRLPQWVSFFKDLPKTAKDYGYRFTEEECALVLGGNARRLFNI